MPPERSADVKFEIGHVLFIDIVGYSKLLINEQSEQIQTLKQVVRGTEQFRLAKAEGKLLGLPTGDGGALVFRTSPEAPVLCAIEICRELKRHPELRVRMGIHSGPVNEISDLNEQANIAGAGINIAQRVMDCADAGHILLSQHVADDLEQYPRWRAHLHDLGECAVKHGVRVRTVSFYTEEVGNPEVPEKFKLARRRRWLIGAAAASFVALAVAIGTLAYQRAQSSSQLDRAIAVLPFESLSSHADDRFFAIGIQDEILTKLASLADLKVIARTSTKGYESRPVDLRTVGRQLGVGRVLEGSLQRSADKVRVSVQLIDTRTNAHLWANSYDRKLDDIFAVQTEIANAIAQQLDAKLVQRISTKPPTANMAAYSAYLRGLGIEQSQSSGTESAGDSATAYAEAVQLDPNFALAWARLSMVRSFLYYHGVDTNVNSAAAVKEAADRALALAPELGQAWLAQGVYRWRVLNDPAAALQTYREAERRLPNNGLVNEYIAFAERRLGRWREAEAHYLRAIELDPRNSQLWSRLAFDILWPLGRAAEAHAAYDRCLEISPNNEFVITLKAEQYQDEGRLDEAARQLARIPEDSTDKTVLIYRVHQAVLERKFDKALFWAKKATSSPSPGQAHGTQDIYALVQQGYCQLWAGHHEDARATFERVIQEVAPGGVLRTPPILMSRLYLAAAYAALGDKSNVYEQARQGVAEYEKDAVLKPLAEAFRARVLAQAGEVDAALDALPHLLEVPEGIHPGELRSSPYWDPLRKDPRFEALVRNPPPVRY